MRAEAVAFRRTIERGSTIFESEFEQFRGIVERVPSAVQESVAVLQDLAGVGSRYFSEVQRYGLERKRDHMCRVLDAIIATANERLRDVEGEHVSRWVDNPYTLDTSRDLQSALTQIVTYLATSNSLSQIPELDDVRRRNLIDLCETIVSLLKGPKVELGLLSRCAKALRQIAPAIALTAVNAAVTVAVNQLMEPAERCDEPNQTESKAAA